MHLYFVFINHIFFLENWFGSNEHWAAVLHTKSTRVRSSPCLKCGTPLGLDPPIGPFTVPPSRLMTWENLTRCMVEYLGVSSSLLLLKQDLPRGALSAAFYQSCIDARLKETRKKSLLHR